MASLSFLGLERDGDVLMLGLAGGLLGLTATLLSDGNVVIAFYVVIVAKTYRRLLLGLVVVLGLTAAWPVSFKCLKSWVLDSNLVLHAAHIYRCEQIC